MIISQDNPSFSDLQNAKRRFFALRNGIVADALRKAGDPHRIIFGLTLVQIREVAASTPHNAELARMLWANHTTRCSRLLAPMVMPLELITGQEARDMLSDIMSAEEADVLCHALLRKLPYAPAIAEESVTTATTQLQAYAALRLCFNLVYAHPALAQKAAMRFVDCEWTIVAHLANRLQNEAEFVLSERK